MLCPMMDTMGFRYQLGATQRDEGEDLGHAGGVDATAATSRPWLAAAAERLTVAERGYRAAAPLVFGATWLAARASGAPAAALRARAGFLPPGAAPLLWFHGASAGEMTAAINLAALLRAAGYAFTAAYTSTNRAGLERVVREDAAHLHALAPWDVPRWVGRALDTWRPAALFLVETELWPTLICEAVRRKVPVFCVSARIYPRDVRRYRAIRWLIGPTLRRVTAVLAQDDDERGRFLAIGAEPARCVAAGNLKHLAANGRAAASAGLGAELGLREAQAVVVCGSVHGDELQTVYTALRRAAAPGLRIVIAPRHHTACAAAVEMAVRLGWRVHRRTAGAPPRQWDVLVLDTIGELAAAYGLATLAVVGGGFERHGGHNPFEAVAAGAPVIMGTHFDHFAQEAIALTAVTPEAQVRDAEELGRRIGEWLADGGARRQIATRQRAVLPDAGAIAHRYLTAVSPWLSGVHA